MGLAVLFCSWGYEALLWSRVISASLQCSVWKDAVTEIPCFCIFYNCRRKKIWTEEERVLFSSYGQKSVLKTYWMAQSEITNDLRNWQILKYINKCLHYTTKCREKKPHVNTAPQKNPIDITAHSIKILLPWRPVFSSQPPQCAHSVLEDPPWCHVPGLIGLSHCPSSSSGWIAKTERLPGVRHHKWHNLHLAMSFTKY